MAYLTIQAQHVQPGDQIYDRGAYHPGHQWVTVRTVETRAPWVVITTSGWTTYKHAHEGIAVRAICRACSHPWELHTPGRGGYHDPCRSFGCGCDDFTLPTTRGVDIQASGR